MQFDLKIIPPTVTAQEHKVAVVRGKPVFYDTAKLKDTRKLFETMLRMHAPENPMEGALELSVDWRFLTKSHHEDAWRTTRPDTDNLQKLLKDCMTAVGFWNDDAQVCVENVTKRWSRNNPGLTIKVVSAE